MGLTTVQRKGAACDLRNQCIGSIAQIIRQETRLMVFQQFGKGPDDWPCNNAVCIDDDE